MTNVPDTRATGLPNELTAQDVASLHTLTSEQLESYVFEAQATEATTIRGYLAMAVIHREKRWQGRHDSFTAYLNSIPMSTSTAYRWRNAGLALIERFGGRAASVGPEKARQAIPTGTISGHAPKPKPVESVAARSRPIEAATHDVDAPPMPRSRPPALPTEPTDLRFLLALISNTEPADVVNGLPDEDVKTIVRWAKLIQEMRTAVQPAMPAVAESEGQPTPGEVCLHPVSRRLGTTCVLCGKTVGR